MLKYDAALLVSILFAQQRLSERRVKTKFAEVEPCVSGNTSSDILMKISIMHY
jgi:hypothetical protein